MININNLIDLKGQIIKGWRVLEHTHTGKQSAWVCECTCDTVNKTVKTFMSSKLRSSIVRSCHCNKNINNGCEVCGDLYHNVEYRRDLNMILCTKHKNQIKKYGKPLDNISRTIYDENEILYYEDYAEIILYNINNIEIARAIIDLDDVEECKKYKWYLIQNNDEFGFGYTASKSINGSTYLLHKLISNTDNSILIDHINCNKLDCRKINLRFADKSKNSQNRIPPSTNTSGFTGVVWSKTSNRWYSKLELNHKNINIGSSKDKRLAILMRIEAEMKYFGEFRNKHNENEFKRIYNEDPIEALLQIN